MSDNILVHDSSLSTNIDSYSIMTIIANKDIGFFSKILHSLDNFMISRVFYYIRHYKSYEFIDIIYNQLLNGNIKPCDIIVYGAVQVENMNLLNLLIDLDIDLNTPNSRTCEALCSACIVGNYNIVEFLINYGLNINHNNGEPFQLAAEFNHVNVCRLLLNYGVIVDLNSPETQKNFIWAIKKNYFEIVQIYIDLGIDLNFINDNDKNDNNGYEKIIDLLLSKNISVTNILQIILNKNS
ncbi:putative ankyrin repeat protein [Powai lake megavirus]|uniref:Putative ankyrin repeat protein n=1 Tax=Powai lake megavirus TaxID=1842663 RepID=A0A167RMN0_9VIRU|nr:putative ankyrin repeat protein [Powai lake megavirus]ANB50883.1 putative ankyrin repeat protein [Powai lake megavirus]